MYYQFDRPVEMCIFVVNHQFASVIYMLPWYCKQIAGCGVNPIVILHLRLLSHVDTPLVDNLEMQGAVHVKEHPYYFS